AALPGASLLAPAPARAQDAPPEMPPQAADTDPARVRQTDSLRADQLFQEAIALSDQGKWQEACPKFRESLAAEASVGTLLNVAACSVREGDRLQGAREYRRVLELNASTNDPERRRSVDTTARQALEKLEASLARVTIRVTPEGAAPRLRVDGKTGARLGEPFEIEPGEHVIEADADGFSPVARKLALTAGARDVVVIALVRSEKKAAPVEPEKERGVLGTAGWITGLGGAAFLTTGAILVGLAGDRAAAIRAECGPRVAPPLCPLGSAEVADDLAAEGRAFEISGYVGLGIGGAAIATAIGLLAADAVASAPAPAQVGLAASESEVGLWMAARF
ncbi:MAG TPA: hypothetical protein VGF17_30590, partial [Phytomonospora sp.]